MILKRLITKIILHFLMIVILFGFGSSSFADSALVHWKSPFDGNTVEFSRNDSLSLDQIVSLISEKNPILKSFEWRQKSAEEHLNQAGLWSNPEFEIEIEEFGWDAPGLDEREMTFLLSQELELFGQRGARKKFAEAKIELTKWENQKSAYGLYLDAKLRFFRLAYAQEQTRLASEAMDLANTIHEDISVRISKGAALQAELLLSQLELQKVQLELLESFRYRKNASLRLSSLWGELDSNAVVIGYGISKHDCLKKIRSIDFSVDSSGNVIDLLLWKSSLESEKKLSNVEARPSLTFSGGYKRLESDRSNSFVLGVSFPLPLFNRNQGQKAALQADINVLDYEISQSKIEISMEINSRIGEIVQLDEKHELIDTLLLPTAEKTYQSLQQAYHAGRIPYTSLLEGERALIELRSEKNNIHFAIRIEQVELERLIGIPLEKIEE